MYNFFSYNINIYGSFRQFMTHKLLLQIKVTENTYSYKVRNYDDFSKIIAQIKYEGRNGEPSLLSSYDQLNLVTFPLIFITKRNLRVLCG